MGAARRAGDPDISWIFFSLRRRIRWSHRRRACSDNKCRDRQFIVVISEIKGKPASPLVLRPAVKLGWLICANTGCDFLIKSQLCTAFERSPLPCSDASHQRLKDRTDCHFPIQTRTGGQITLCHTAPHSLSFAFTPAHDETPSARCVPAWCGTSLGLRRGGRTVPRGIGGPEDGAVGGACGGRAHRRLRGHHRLRMAGRRTTSPRSSSPLARLTSSKPA